MKIFLKLAMAICWAVGFSGPVVATGTALHLCGKAGVSTVPGRAVDRGVDSNMATPASVLMIRRAFDGQPQQCGGVLVSDRWVLTARHCVDGQIWKSLTIRWGSARGRAGDPGGVRRGVAAFCPTPKAIGLQTDVALIKLDRPVPGYIQRPSWPDPKGFHALGLPELLQFARWRNVLGPAGNQGLTISPLSIIGRGYDGLLQADMVNRYEAPPCGGESGSAVYREAGDRKVLVGVLSAIQTPRGAATCSSPRSRALITPVGPWRDWVEDVIAHCPEGKCAATG